MSDTPSSDDKGPLESPEPSLTPPPKRPRQLVKTATVRVTYEAPLPPPNMMQAYEEILPGSADRIIAMAERQSVHRQGMETNVVHSNSVTERRGQIFAFILGLVGLVGAIWLAHEGKI